MTSPLLRADKMKFLQAFNHLKVLIIGEESVRFAKAKAKDIRRAMEHLDHVIVDYSYNGRRRNIAPLDGPLPVGWLPNKIKFDAKTANYQDYHLNQILDIDVECGRQWTCESLTADHAEAAKRIVNLKDLFVRLPLCQLQKQLFASIIAPNLESVVMNMYQMDFYSSPPILGPPHLRVRHLKIYQCTFTILKMGWMGWIARKYPRVTKLTVSLRRASDIDDISSLLEILSDSFLDLTDITIEFTQWEPKWFDVCRITKERLLEYFPERVSFNLSCHPLKHAYYIGNKLAVIKPPFKDSKYYFWLGGKEEPYVADTIFLLTFACEDNAMYFPAW